NTLRRHGKHGLKKSTACRLRDGYHPHARAGGQKPLAAGCRTGCAAEIELLNEQESLSVGYRRRWGVAADDDERVGRRLRSGYALQKHGGIDRVADLHAGLKRPFGDCIHDLHAVLKLVHGYTSLRVIRRLVVPSPTGQQPAASSLRLSLPPPPAHTPGPFRCRPHTAPATSQGALLAQTDRP